MSIYTLLCETINKMPVFFDYKCEVFIIKKVDNIILYINNLYIQL